MPARPAGGGGVDGRGRVVPTLLAAASAAIGLALAAALLPLSGLRLAA